MSNRHVLITGGSRGIGAAICERFKAEGYRVLAPSRQELDLLSDDSVDRYLSLLQEPVDVLVNNAGINLIQSGKDVTDDAFRETLQTNLVSPFRLTRALMSGMVERGFGRIVNISSVWALVSKEGRLTYAMSKSALTGMTRTLAVELAPHNVLVNAVAPGFVNTELTRQNNSPEQIETIRRGLPIGRLAEPGEIAGVVFFLGSEMNTYVTGQVIPVDGGFTCL